MSTASNSLVRPEIQGLRALAVLLVVLFHAGLPGLGAGYIGVDVFFVISGYLISQLLLVDRARHGHIRLGRFFARRAKRLLPAALLLLLVVTAVSVWLYPPAEQREWLSATRAAALYVSNFWLAGRALDYFAADSHANPLLHTWSLSVEEQFYLVWPLVLVWLLRPQEGVDSRRMRWGLPMLVLLSFMACVWVTRQAQPWAFFGTPLRAWEFGLGALVAARGSEWQARARGLGLGWLGLILVLGSAMALPEAISFPGAWALLPALGTALMLCALQAESAGPSRLFHLLSTRPLVWLGDLSYSWYLWHWPALVWLQVLEPKPQAWQTATAVALSLLMAWLSLRWVENPIRHFEARWLTQGRTLVLSLGTSLLLALLVTAVQKLPHGEKALALAPIEAAVKDRPKLYASNCHQYFFDSAPTPCHFGSTGAAQHVVLVGDSHAAQWFPALEGLGARWRVTTMTKAACPAFDAPVHNPSLGRRYHECERWREQALQEVLRLRPNWVLLSSANYYRIDADERAQGLLRWVKALRQSGSQVLVLRDSPRPGFNPVSCVARAQWRGDAQAQACHFARGDGAVWAPAIALAERSALEGVEGARYLDLSEAICAQSRCEVRQGQAMFFADEHHLTAGFAATLAPRLQQAFGAQTGGK